MIITANIFQNTIHEPIVYAYSSQNQYYKNFPSTGTSGIEIAYRWIAPWGSLDLNYTKYKANSQIPDDYKVPEDSQALLASPNQKINLQTQINLINDRNRLHFNLTQYSSQYGYDWNSSQQSFVITQTKPIYLGSVYWTLKNIFSKQLEGGFGVENVFNMDHRIFQAYDGSHPSMAAPSREYFMKLSYLWE